ncbi:hypothetical protein [Novosphingobium sp.]|uniref:hypothetical protein n=1 Tax=Novosphingobium sp. TaxID=1874826 RepID=UPI0034346DC9
MTRALLDAMDGHGYDRVQPPTIEFEKPLASRMAGISLAPDAPLWWDPASRRPACAAT